MVITLYNGINAGWYVWLRRIYSMKNLAHGIRKYIRRQKMIIRSLGKDKKEEERLIRELLDRFFK